MKRGLLSYGGRKGDWLMKRDILLLAACLCVLIGVNWLGDHRAESVSAAVWLDKKPTLILDA